LVKNGKAFRPLEGNTCTGASEVFTKKIDNNFYIGVVNYSKNNKAFFLSSQRLGIDVSKVIQVKELLQGNTMELKDGIKLTLNGADAALYKCTFRK
jgi:alpha-galactosidase